MVYLEQEVTVFEICSTVSLDISGLLLGTSDFVEDIVS